MLDLAAPRWAELQTAYGPASDIPGLLRALEPIPSHEDYRDEPWFSIWSALAHQGDVYSASFAAVPHVVRVLASAPERAGSDYFHFPAWVDICRERTGTPIPSDLEDAYAAALARLPALASAAAAQPWDEPMLQSVLAAVAVAKGETEIAEAALELTAEIAPDFLKWVRER